MARHLITHADELFWGNAHKHQANNSKRGLPLTPIVQIDLGAPLTLDADGLIKAATSTELPNTETVTYTTATAGTSPLDGANQTWVLDVPRNITIAVTHGSSVVAMTIVVTGTDEYGETMAESLSIAATGTSQAAAGLKAFKTVTSIAITAAADAEANTMNLGWGDVLGLPYCVAGKYDILQAYADTTADIASATVVAAVATSPATATTGDVRGTIDFNTACNGSVNFRVWMKIKGVDTQLNAFGVDQYAG